MNFRIEVFIGGSADPVAIGAPACIANAVSDAIGAEVVGLPMTPHRVRARRTA